MSKIDVVAAGSLYEKQVKVYPHDVTGRFATLRQWAMYILLGLFYFRYFCLLNFWPWLLVITGRWQ